MNHKIFFFWGILGTFFSLVLEILLQPIIPSNQSFLWTTTPLPAFVEEVVKFVLLWKLSINISNKKDIIIGSLLLGLGFSSAEILLNIFRINQLHPGFLGLTTIHTITSLLAGYFLWDYHKKKQTALLLILFANIFIHILYNEFITL